MSQRLASPPASRQNWVILNLFPTMPLCSQHVQKHRSNLPGGCEAEVCMSHMDPVSGTDIDLFIEGIIPCSLHLEHETNTKLKRPLMPSDRK